ncbi:MAG: hypothetical protein U9P63_01525 [Patescibacteria group bacterium]|nr:hypothetical protein [Patescibacteria group bacterium]
MANEMTTAVIAALLPDIKAKSIMQLNNNADILKTVAWEDTEGQEGANADFSFWSLPSSGDVGTPAEGISYTTNTKPTISEVVMKPTRHTLRNVFSSLAGKSKKDIVQKLSLWLTNGMLAKLEAEITALASGFTNSVGGTTTAMSTSLLFEALQYINATGYRGPIYGIISSQQFYHPTLGLATLFDNPKLESGVIGEALKINGIVTSFYGINWIISNEIDDSGDSATGMIMAPGAIGLHSKGLVNAKAVEDVDIGLSATKLVVEGMWKCAELVDNYGVAIETDITA